MGIFRKIDELDKTVDMLVEGAVSTAVNKAVDFALTKDYESKLYYNGRTVGTISYTTADPEFTLQKINNYLNTGCHYTEIEPIIGLYYGLDSANIGASKQIVKLDESELRLAVISAKQEIERQKKEIELNESEFVLTTEKVDENNRLAVASEYWDNIHLGDSVEIVKMKTKDFSILSKDLGIYKITTATDKFDIRTFTIIDGKVECLSAIKYFDSDPCSESATDWMKDMLPYVRNTLFNGTKLKKLVKYKDDTISRTPESFSKVIKDNTLQFGYVVSERVPSPSFMLLYDEVYSDNLVGKATIASYKAITVMRAMQNKASDHIAALKSTDRIGDDIQECYNILNVYPSCSDEELIEAYVRKLREYDVSGLDISSEDEEVITYFDAMRSRAKEAYRKIKAEKASYNLCIDD